MTEFVKKEVSSENESALGTSAAVEEDHEFILEFVPPSAIKTLTSEYISVTIMRTAYARVSLAVSFLGDYPTKIPGIELTSPTLPYQLLRNKEKECIAVAKETQNKRKAGEDTSGRTGLVEAIYGHIYSFIHTNLFVPCWREIKQVYSKCENTKHTVSSNDKQGLLILQLRCGAYLQTVRVAVSETYPEHPGVLVSIPSCNTLVSLLVLHAC